MSAFHGTLSPGWIEMGREAPREKAFLPAEPKNVLDPVVEVSLAFTGSRDPGAGFN